jgi:hypothetical protein
MLELIGQWTTWKRDKKSHLPNNPAFAYFVKYPCEGKEPSNLAKAILQVCSELKSVRFGPWSTQPKTKAK